MADTNNQDNDIILNIQVRYEDAINGISKYKKVIDEARQSNKELRVELDKNEISQDDYNKAVEANNVVIDQCNNKTRALRKEIQNNIKIEQEQKGSVIALQAEIAKLNREYEHLGDTEDDIAKRNALGLKIKNLQGDLNELNAARGRFQGQVGNYENAIKNALGLNNEFASSLLKMSENSQTGEKSLKSFFSNAGTSAQAFGKSLLSLMSNPVFLAIAGIVGVGVAFKFWYDYNKGLVEATKLTKDFTKLSGSELKTFRNEVQGVSDTFGKDFKETLIATNAVAKQFGISQQEALQYVKDGFIAGADANGEYLDTLKEYPAYFKEAGISASQFVAITAQTAQEGVFSDKGIDAIKEANLRIREMSTSTASALDGIGISSKKVQKDLQNGMTTPFKVMQQVSAKLAEYPEQSKQVGTAIADIFGGAGEDAGLQYLKTLKDIDTNLDEVKKRSGELGEIQERQMNANIELQNAVSTLFDQTGGAFEKMTGDAKIFATESLTSIVNGLTDIANWFIRIYNKNVALRGLMQSIVFYFNVQWDILKGLFSFIIDNLKAIGTMLEGYLTFDFSKFKEGFAMAFAAAKDNAVKTAKEIAKDATKAYNDTINATPLKEFGSDGSTTSTTDTKDETQKDPFIPKPDPEKLKKAIEAEKKAALELAKLQLETQINSQKEIAADQDKSYNDRLKALNNYYQQRRAYIEYVEKEELKNKEITESQKKLIQAKANQQIIALDKELGDTSLKLMQEQEAKELSVLQSNIQNRLAVIKKGSNEELALKLQQIELQRQAEIDAAEKTGADKAAINAKYDKQEKLLRQENAEYIRSQEQKALDNKIKQAEYDSKNELSKNVAVTQAKIAAKQAEIAALTQLENESDTDYLNRQLSLKNEQKKLEDDLLKYQIEKQTQYMEAVSKIAGGFSDLFESLAEDSEAFAEFSKAMALFQIGIDTATALTKGIAAAQAAGPFPANLIAIATTTSTILANIAKAKKYLTSSKQPSYATGGLVSGSGSGTSDSISARLSNGESVLTARATSMFSPILSAFNQIGGGVPIATQDVSNQVMGEEMLSRSFAKAVQSMPNPVVSVQEIDNVNNRIKILETSKQL